MAQKPQNPKCPRCGKSVYHAERALGAGKEWHRNCLTCFECNKRLDSTTLCERGEKIYCKACYARLFGPHGFGYAGGGAIMHTQGGFYQPEPHPETQLPTVAKCPGCQKEFKDKIKFCPECGTKVAQ